MYYALNLTTGDYTSEQALNQNKFAGPAIFDHQILMRITKGLEQFIIIITRKNDVSTTRTSKPKMDFKTSTNMSLLPTVTIPMH